MDLQAAATKLVEAWERDGGGFRSVRAVERWLAEDMKPAVDDLREALGRPRAPSVEDQKREG